MALGIKKTRVVAVEDPTSIQTIPGVFRIPSFLKRDFHFGYERECYDLFFGGETKEGAREDLEVQIARAVRIGYLPNC